MNTLRKSKRYTAQRLSLFHFAKRCVLFTMDQAKLFAWQDKSVKSQVVKGTLFPLVEDGYLDYCSGIPLRKRSYAKKTPLYPLPQMNGRLPTDGESGFVSGLLRDHYPLPTESAKKKKDTRVYFPTPKLFDELRDGQEQFADQDAHIPKESIDPDANEQVRKVEGIVQEEGRFNPRRNLEYFAEREGGESLRAFNMVVRFLNLTDLYIRLTQTRMAQANHIRESWVPCITFSARLYLPCSYAVYSPDGERKFAAAFCRNVGAKRIGMIHHRLRRYDEFAIY